MYRSCRMYFNAGHEQAKHFSCFVQNRTWKHCADQQHVKLPDNAQVQLLLCFLYAKFANSLQQNLLPYACQVEHCIFNLLSEEPRHSRVKIERSQ